MTVGASLQAMILCAGLEQYGRDTSALSFQTIGAGVGPAYGIEKKEMMLKSQTFVLLTVRFGCQKRTLSIVNHREHALEPVFDGVIDV